jgi:outer membrane receptor for monomeric catechols
MSIQDIPQTVSVVTSDFLQDSMSVRMLDAAKYVTPVVESTLPIGGDRYTIRGFQVSHEFIDGMVMSGEDGYSMSLAPYNIDRIEIRCARPDSGRRETGVWAGMTVVGSRPDTMAIGSSRPVRYAALPGCAPRVMRRMMTN